MKTILLSYRNILIILIVLSSTTWFFHLIVAENTTKILENDKITGLHIANAQKRLYFDRVQHILEPASKTPEIVNAATGIESEASNNILLFISKVFSGAVAYIINSKGIIVDSTPYNTKGDVLNGRDLSFRPYFQLAKTQDFVVYPALGKFTKSRGLYFSKGIFSKEKFLGAIVVKLQLTEIEAQLQNDTQLNAALMTPEGIIFATTEKQYLYKTFFKLSDDTLAKIKESQQFSGVEINNIGEINRKTITIGGVNYYYEVINTGYSGWKILIFREVSSYKLPQAEKTMLWVIAVLLILVLTLYFKYKLAVENRSK